MSNETWTGGIYGVSQHHPQCVCGGGGGTTRAPYAPGPTWICRFSIQTFVPTHSSPPNPAFLGILFTAQSKSSVTAHLSSLDPGPHRTSASLGFQCGWCSNNSSQHCSNSAARGLSPPLGTPSISEVTHLGHWPVKGRHAPARHRPAEARACSAGGKGKNWCGLDSPENQFQGPGEHSRHRSSSRCSELSSWPGRDGILGSDHKNGSLRMTGRK